MKVYQLAALLSFSTYLGGVSAAYCNNTPSLIWQCFRPDKSNSGYTASCCPGGSYQQDGACCTENWQAFKSCCTAHPGYWAANG
ncbi:hypothetical protein GQ607_003761 [Colletotrichum asianum]|uniref:Uncharacterized protein n=1 Tax=Colletotrichum asianum TaxID=702518 RepID=A0A8H3ZRH1_9PEZI|nr:hypothetical protein GQ607_003761 [Colletotrichum asianum]